MDALLQSISTLELRKKELLLEIDNVNEVLSIQKAQYAKLSNNQVPIYRLPNELLTAIFITCQQTIRPSTKATVPPFQVAMSHISHRWREIVLATPLLWNTINFHIRALNHVQKRTLALLEAHLMRSGSCFLDITLEFHIEDDIFQYLALLKLESRRWRRLSICKRVSQFADIKTLLQDADAPILEHLSLTLGRGAEPLSPRIQYHDVSPAILTDCLSPLKFVRLAGLAVGDLHPPLTSVTTLHLDGWTRHFMTHQQLRAILKSSTSLVNLSINQLCIQHPRDPSEIFESISLPHLQCLRLVGPCPTASQPLCMLMMKMPQLHSLTLIQIDSFEFDILPSVKSLTMDTCALRDTDIIHLFNSLPSITTIKLDESVPDLFHLLLPNPNRTTPWPQLKSISLRDLQSLDVPPFCNMLLEIQETHKELSTVYLDRRSRTVLRTKHKLDFLKRDLKLEVVNSDSEEPWPVGLGYDDPHDLIE